MIIEEMGSSKRKETSSRTLMQLLLLLVPLFIATARVAYQYGCSTSTIASVSNIHHSSPSFDNFQSSQSANSANGADSDDAAGWDVERRATSWRRYVPRSDLVQLSGELSRPSEKRGESADAMDEDDPDRPPPPIDPRDPNDKSDTQLWRDLNDHLHELNNHTSMERWLRFCAQQRKLRGDDPPESEARTVIVTLANAPYIPLLRFFYDRVAKFNMSEPVVVFCVDDDTLRQCEIDAKKRGDRHPLYCYQAPKLVRRQQEEAAERGLCNEIGGGSSFSLGSANFWELMQLKAEFIRVHADACRMNVLWTESDVVWRRNPLCARDAYTSADCMGGRGILEGHTHDRDAILLRPDLEAMTITYVNARVRDGIAEWNERAGTGERSNETAYQFVHRYVQELTPNKLDLYKVNVGLMFIRPTPGGLWLVRDFEFRMKTKRPSESRVWEQNVFNGVLHRNLSMVIYDKYVVAMDENDESSSLMKWRLLSDDHWRLGHFDFNTHWIWGDRHDVVAAHAIATEHYSRVHGGPGAKVAAFRITADWLRDDDIAYLFADKRADALVNTTVLCERTRHMRMSVLTTPSTNAPAAIVTEICAHFNREWAQREQQDDNDDAESSETSAANSGERKRGVDFIEEEGVGPSTWQWQQMRSFESFEEEFGNMNRSLLPWTLSIEGDAEPNICYLHSLGESSSKKLSETGASLLTFMRMPEARFVDAVDLLLRWRRNGAVTERHLNVSDAKSSTGVARLWREIGSGSASRLSAVVRLLSGDADESRKLRAGLLREAPTFYAYMFDPVSNAFGCSKATERAAKSTTVTMNSDEKLDSGETLAEALARHADACITSVRKQLNRLRPIAVVAPVDRVEDALELVSSLWCLDDEERGALRDVPHEGAYTLAADYAALLDDEQLRGNIRLVNALDVSLYEEIERLFDLLVRRMGYFV